MKTIDQRLEAKKKRLSDLGVEMDALQELNQVVGISSWQAIDTWLGREILQRHLELAQQSTSMERTHVLRGELAAMNLLRNLPKSVMQDLNRNASEADSLRAQFQEWHNRGRTELRSAVDQAANLSSRNPT